MAKSANPFAEYDFTKVWGDFKVPAFDVEALMAAQQRNFDAMSVAGKLAVEGFQLVAQRQAEFVRDAVEQTTEAAQEYAKLAKPEDKLAQQAKYAKTAFQTGLDNMRELGGLMSKTATDAADVMNKRFVEGLDEFETIVATETNGAAPAKATAKPATK